MRVLQINSVCGVGSTGRIATDIHSILLDQGSESHVAYGRGLANNCNQSIKIGSKIDNYFHVLSTRLFDIHGFSSTFATKKLIKEIVKLDPDIIHLHNIHGYYLNIDVLFQYLRVCKKPIIWTLHDCWSFTGHCAYFDFVDCDKWKTKCYNCPQKAEYPKSIIVDRSKKNFDNKKDIFTGVENLTLVTPSKWLSLLVKESYLKDYSVEVINNGIDLDTFKPTSNKFKDDPRVRDKFIILGVASIWEKRKGFDYFLQLSKRLSSEEVIVLVGLNENQMKDLPENVIGITRTNNINDLADLYSSSDIFFNPTLEDNFPTTNLESLACGTPVITFKTGGSVESIDEETGFIIEKGGLDELLKKIEIIKESDQNSYVLKCRNRAVNLYNKNEKFIEYIQLYNKKLK
ncbi:glycosyltransferase [Alkalicella caledoniensis]|uniref:Glycosyltransferase n=1 Tax=Alkalicella caledoniensis TaxID=2731377 RepID=A0A7G9W407_ALKCA|nr:glycosyltransferase [Alkalicella caledoniensis]QNO13419.1 glycosyltransferase [Alkalicella caledoniensis]